MCMELHLPQLRLHGASRANDQVSRFVVWRAQNWDGDTRTFFRAARGLVTTQGTVHVQRAGLQRGTKHGIFHSPSTPKREGWRVAISARITRADAVARVDGFCSSGCYSMELGPEGEWRLP